MQTPQSGGLTFLLRQNIAWSSFIIPFCHYTIFEIIKNPCCTWYTPEKNRPGKTCAVAVFPAVCGRGRGCFHGDLGHVHEAGCVASGGAPAGHTARRGRRRDRARSGVGLLTLVAIGPRPCEGPLNGSRAARRPGTAAQGLPSLPTGASLAFLVSSGARAWEPLETRAPLFSASAGPSSLRPAPAGAEPPGGLGVPFRARLCATSFPLRTLPP